MSGTLDKPCATCKYGDFREWLKNGADPCLKCTQASEWKEKPCCTPAIQKIGSDILYGCTCGIVYDDQEGLRKHTMTKDERNTSQKDTQKSGLLNSIREDFPG